MLKWIALMLMIVDHFAYVFMDFIPYDLYVFLRTVGRLSFPVFVYYVVLGLGRTSNLKKYMSRLLLFAVISEITIRSFEIFQHSYVNVIFSFFLYGLFYILLENKLNIKESSYLIMLVLMLIVPYVEYGYSGLLVFFSLYLVNKKVSDNKKSLYSALLITMSFVIGIIFFKGLIISLFAGFSGFLMFRKSMDKRVFYPKFEKWAFYIFYPLQWILYGLAYSYVIHSISM